MANRYVVLRGIEQGNVFWSTMGAEETEETVRYLNDGTLAYDVILITESEAEAQSAWANHAPWGFLAGPDWRN
jgi:hypothetical protein